MKKLLGLLLLVVVLVTSCGEDENEMESGNLSPEEAATQINGVVDQMDDDIIEMMESEGIDALRDLVQYFDDIDSFDNGRISGTRALVRSRLLQISQTFVEGPAARVTSDDAFSFDDIKGIWEWNPETEEFEKQEEAAVFTVRFPTKGSTTNNAELTISRLEFVSIASEDDWGVYTEQYPTAIEGNLKVDGVTYIALEVSVTYDQAGVPTKGSATLDIFPFSFSLSFDDTAVTSSMASASISKSGETLMAASATIFFEAAGKEEITSVEGFVQYLNLRIAGSVDASFDWDDESDINDFVDLEVLIDDEKVGDIIFEDDIAYLVYADGSKENLEELLEPIVESIEEALDEVEDDDFDDEDDFEL